MKYLLTILGLTFVTDLRAQSLNDIEARLRLLEKKDPVRYDTTGLYLLPRSKYQCDDHFDAFDYPTQKTTLDYYLVTDLNGDGYNDLIYSGPCLPYDVTGIFLNEGNELKLVYEYGGQLVSIEKDKSVTRINIFYEALGCNNYSELIQVTIDKKSQVERNHIIFASWSNIAVDRVEKVKVKGVIRTTCEVDDQDKKDLCSTQVLKGNHLAQVKKSSSVVQLLTNGQWKLVLYSEDKETSWLGWIKPE